jgi:formamidopyrimidine-DNA glycosylase
MSLLIHLRMTGRLYVRPLAAQGEAHERAILPLREKKETSARKALVLNDPRVFGRLHLVRDEKLATWPEWKKLGPEPFDLTAKEFAARLRAKNRRLKPLLLDQTFLAGLGNIYTDEALYAARLHPLRAASSLSAPAAERLFREIVKVLNAAIAAGGTTVSDFADPDGREGRFWRKLRIYGREGEACKSCRATVRRIVVGGRGTWFCPKCQRQ